MIESVVHVRLLSRERLGFLNVVYCLRNSVEKRERRLGIRRSQDRVRRASEGKRHSWNSSGATCSLGRSRSPKLLIISTSNVVCMYCAYVLCGVQLHCDVCVRPVWFGWLYGLYMYVTLQGSVLALYTTVRNKHKSTNHWCEQSTVTLAAHVRIPRDDN